MNLFENFKVYLVAHAGLAKDALHIYVGLILFFGAMLVMRWPVRSWKPWLVVLVATFIGELLDLAKDKADNRFLYLHANWHDIWNTMFWPTVILMLARWTPIFTAKR